MSSRILSVALTATTTVALTYAALEDFSVLIPWGIPIVVAVAVGGLLTYRVPANPVGWLVLVFAFASAGVPVILSAVLADEALALALGDAFNTAGVMALPGALLRFPDGTALSPRWRLADLSTTAAALVGFAAALLNGGWGGDADESVLASPLREATAPIGDVLSSAFYVGMLVAMVLASTSLIVRYRRSRGEERLKIKWLAFSGGFLLATFLVVVVAGGWNSALGADWQGVLVSCAFASIPAAIGMAVLQYRLYDIDLVISRTVVLAILAGFITVVYALIVVGIGSMLRRRTDGIALQIAATAIVAVAFEPVRHLAQRWANRLVYGTRASPYEVLSDLTERLSNAEQGQGILERMAARIGDGTGAERAAVWLGDGRSMEPGACWPESEDPGSIVDLDADNVFPVTHDGVVVGAFEVVKPRGTGLSSAERSLISDLAGSAGAVLGYRRLNDSLHAKARELSESRVRLVEAQDTERRRLERDLHDGAQQLIVALKVKIGLARAMATQHGASDIEMMLAGLGEEANEALEEVRSLAKGIYPPVLESDGLGSAISALASGAPVHVVVERDGIARYGRDIEAAVYFDISEAVTNAVKHGAAPIRVALSDTGSRLLFSVTDSGPGFDVSSANGGSGLQNLRDRIDAVGGELEIVSVEGKGTVVTGVIPLQPSRI